MAEFDVIVVGAGAAGMFCALTAGRRGRRVLLLEGGQKPGAKILISGCGRCNFTNLDVSAANFFSGNPHFAKSALARFTARDFLALVEVAGIAWHEKTRGQLFCDGSARQIVDLLLEGCLQAGVTLRTGSPVLDVEHGETGFRVRTALAEFRAAATVIATGGPSIPKLGATDFAWRLGAKLGLPTRPARPALVPLTLTTDSLEHAFGAGTTATHAGLSFETETRCAKTRFRDAALITHRGLSGPAILQISTVWREGSPIVLDLLPGQDAVALLRRGKRERPRISLTTLLGTSLPQRLAASLATRIPDMAGGARR